MQQPSSRRDPAPEPAALDLAAPASAEVPVRRPRRWPLYLIVLGLILSVLWSGLLFWSLAGFVRWLMS